MYTGLIFSLFAIGVSAIKVTSPTDDDVWASGTSGQTVSWEAVNTDATSFAIQLINQVGDEFFVWSLIRFAMVSEGWSFSDIIYGLGVYRRGMVSWALVIGIKRSFATGGRI